jgi:orotidine-5'-phosphate decarboxylase
MKKIILALDVNDHAKALEIVEKFSEHIDVFKVGLELFSSAGPQVVKDIHDRGKKVFLDLKFHDIPNTVSGAALAATRLGVYMFNVHTSSGIDAMKRCSDDVIELCLKENIERPKIIGVTVLTSLSQEILRDEFGIQHSLRTHVKNLSKMALKAGLDGVVASGQEASMIRKHCGNDFLIITPGIRTSWAPPDDQKRTMTPKDAIREGADFLVVGRSILKQADAEKALDLIQLEILTSL